MNTALRFGILGLGRGSSGMIVALARHPATRIAAAADLRREPLERFGHDFDVATFTSAEELCASPEVDVVYVATPHQFHAEHAAYLDFLYRPRRPEELDTALGGGIIFNQVPHQVDAVRLVGGGMVRSVRAVTGVWDPDRPTEGSYAASLDFEDGAVAVLVYNGYDHFHSGEFRTWIDPARRQEAPHHHGQTRKRLRRLSPEKELALVAASGYGSDRYDHVVADLWQQELGNMIVSCERGDIRLVGDGLLIYDDEGKREVPIAVKEGAVRGRADVLDEIVAGVLHGRPLAHDGRWGKATMAVCLAILQSARERREIFVRHQVPTVDAGLLV